jgi:beta-lactam-binding protein with PASTA domain/predicted Ser/Thr protein kinase
VVEPDTLIDGRYRVISRLGSGGMADVYLAEDQLLGRQVAVKVLHHHFAEDQEFVERFRREASSAAGLSHPNIVGIFDRGEWNGTYYIAMEYVAGRSLKKIVREQGPLDPAMAIDIVVQILRATWFAHKRGVIHRDLKPHNVLLDEEGRARVTDFGIARAGASDMTLTGSIMGTAQYLSPEQAQGQAVSVASDLYSVGVILYELLTGVVPFEGETAVAIAFKQVSAEPRPPSALNPSLPLALDGVVLCALAKDPAQRYADAEQFIAVLQRVRGELPNSPGAPPGAPAPPPRSHAATGALLLPAAGRFDEDPASAPDGARRRRAVLLGLVGALVLALVALVLLLSSSGGRVTVPDVTGQTESVALQRLKRAGLNPVAAPTASATVNSGLVLGETPPRGSVVGKGTRVTVLVSSGPGSAPLGNFEGLTYAQTAARLRAAGFKPTRRTEPSATVRQGRVISTNPPAGTELQVGSPVMVLVSSGPAQVRVPDVTGQPQTAAEATLTAVSLTVGTITQQVSTARAPGTVLSQSPQAGASVPTGTTVNMTVAKASNEVVVPKVVGQSEAKAAAALGGAGFIPAIVSVTTVEPSLVGQVVKQSPAAGRSARRGSTVTLTVAMLGPQTTPTTPTTTPTGGSGATGATAAPPGP